MTPQSGVEQIHRLMHMARPYCLAGGPESLSANKLKVKYRISVADAWIAALAKERNATLVHKDPEFEQIEDRLKILHLPYK
jgi:predicted nucleic acid-binding protein